MRSFSRGILGGSAVAIAIVTACVSDAPDVVTVTTDGGSSQNTDGSAITTKEDSSVKTSSDGGIIAVDSGPKHFCQTASAPDGSADFFCADFDEAALSNGFTDASIDEAGSLSATTLVASSAPNALLAQLPATDGSGLTAQYLWTQSGAKNLSSVTVTFDANPILLTGNQKHDFPGFIILASIATSVGEVDFIYTGGHTFGTEPTPYTGYLVQIVHHGVTIQVDNEFVDPLPGNSWTTVSLTQDMANGLVTLSYSSANDGGFSDGGAELSDPTSPVTETLAYVAVGVQAFEDNTEAYGFRFDNVRGSTIR